MTETTRNADRMTSRKAPHAVRLAQFQFPGVEDTSDLEKTVERRPRVNPNATQEIDAADVLAIEPIESQPCSVMPVAFDIAAHAPPSNAARSDRGGERLALPRPRLGWGIGAALAATGCLLLVIVNVTHASAGPASEEARPAPRVIAAASSLARAEPAVAASYSGEKSVDGVPLVSVMSLPRVIPTTGTIRLIESAAAHRLFVDGAVQQGSSAVVSCGRHMIQVGSAGKAHALIIGCGEETVIAR
jgi:hypothetical protein